MKNTTAPARRPLTTVTSLCCLGLASLAASACSSTFDSGTEDLGDTDVISQNLDTPPSEPFYTSPGDFGGRWVGVASDVLAVGLAEGETSPAYRFPSGATSIVLDLQLLDSGGSVPNVVGTITFGADEPPPPPTDPDVGYPVGLSYIDLVNYDPDAPIVEAFVSAGALPPVEGFAYSVQQFKYGGASAEGLEDGVLLLSYSSAQYLEPWCELQTPKPDGNGGYGCLAPFDQISVDEGVCAVGHDDDGACPADLESLPPDEFASVVFECRQTSFEPSIATSSTCAAPGAQRRGVDAARATPRDASATSPMPRTPTMRT